MPRSGAVYSLPSPPSPYTAGSLAKAEDINTTFNDIATALTNSAPLDGSGSMAGDLAMNGHNISGVNSGNFTDVYTHQIFIDYGAGGSSWTMYHSAGPPVLFTTSYVTGCYSLFDATDGLYQWYNIPSFGGTSFLAMQLDGGGNLKVHGTVTPGGVLLQAPTVESGSSPRRDLQTMLASGRIDVAAALSLLIQLAMEQVPA